MRRRMRDIEQLDAELQKITKQHETQVAQGQNVILRKQQQMMAKKQTQS